MSSDQSTPQHSSPELAAAEAALGGRFDDSVDAATLDDVSPHPPGNQVDRSVVVGEVIKSASLWALRLFIIGLFLYASFRMLGNFWRGILPVLIALIICTVLAPVASALRRKGLPSALAAAITILVSFTAVGSLFVFIAPDFARQSQTLYLQTVEGIQRLQLWAQGPPLNLDPDEIGVYIDEVALWLQRQAGSIAGSVFTGIGTATSIVVTLFIIVVLTFFFLKDGHNFLPWLRDATGRRTGWHLTELLTRVWTTLGGFVRAQAVVSAVDAVFIGLGLALIGVPLAMALAIITFIAGFIPFVGAIVAGALSVTIALVSLGFTKALLVLGLVLLVQQLEGNVLSPWLQSKAMNLHPVIVLISVTVGSALFGLVGGFLAVPAAATIAVVYRYFQDMMMLQSGERTAGDLQFSTVAGFLIGRYTQEQGDRKREKWLSIPDHVAPEGAADDVATDGTSPLDRKVDVDADLSDRESGARAGIKRAIGALEQMLQSKDKD
ncbi:AI-2E family transporter [Corynebacterium sp. FDAARGOS 1242]|uniref:Transporter of the permease n=1 Tax=Corynebacterium minutissimum TaxID=38301 RepID=A0A376CWE2_9CORY|nr:MULTISPECIES: AI-2E family transporter [Corynebacterium]QRP60640.1 AI-2E family transporter [Corynebacterium minutissimum]QRP96889.1 AI-2E family transporter [Corynebacterium sp. FDAARGOS 1242]STC76662.1 transporter of the permease [Corynebacterium minutissimum]